MVVDGAGREDESAGDLLVGESFAEQQEDLVLAAGESEGVLAGAGACSGRDGAVAEILHLLAGTPCGGVGAECLEAGDRLAEVLVAVGVVEASAA